MIFLITMIIISFKHFLRSPENNAWETYSFKYYSYNTTCIKSARGNVTFLRNNNINHRIEFDVNISTVDSRAPDVEALDRGYVA